MTSKSEHRAEMAYEIEKTRAIKLNRVKELCDRGWTDDDIVCVLEISHASVKALKKCAPKIPWCIDCNNPEAECRCRLSSLTPNQVRGLLY